MLQSVLFIARILISMQCNLVCIQTAQKPPTLTWLVYISVNTFKITTLENYTKNVCLPPEWKTQKVYLNQNKTKKGEKGHWKNLSKDKLKFCLEILKIKIDPRLYAETKLSQATIQCNPPVHF